MSLPLDEAQLVVPVSLHEITREPMLRHALMMIERTPFLAHTQQWRSTEWQLRRNKFVDENYLGEEWEQNSLVLVGWVTQAPLQPD